MNDTKSHSKETKNKENWDRNEYLLFIFKTEGTSRTLTVHKQKNKIKPKRLSSLLMGKNYSYWKS